MFCRERATKSEDSMEVRNSSREDLKLDFVTCFTLHLRLFRVLLLPAEAERKRLCIFSSIGMSRNERLFYLYVLHKKIYYLFTIK